MRYVIYSHSSFSDLLEIQETCISNFTSNYFLIIDEGHDYQGKAKKIITYHDSEPFASRLYNSMKKIDDEFVLLIHDIDLLVAVDVDFLDRAAKLMKEKGIDKIDLQHCPQHHWPDLRSPSTCQLSANTYVSRTFFPHDQYVYNVQPSIWRRESLIFALENYRHETYRSIEYSSIQKFCSENIQMYRTVTQFPLSMGYYHSTPEFVFMHMTHYGSLMPVDPSINGMCKFGIDVYHSVLQTKAITESGRQIRNSMYGREVV